MTRCVKPTRCTVMSLKRCYIFHCCAFVSNRSPVIFLYNFRYRKLERRFLGHRCQTDGSLQTHRLPCPLSGWLNDSGSPRLAPPSAPEAQQRLPSTQERGRVNHAAATSGLKCIQQGNSPSQQTRGAQKRAESGGQIRGDNLQKLQPLP